MTPAKIPLYLDSDSSVRAIVSWLPGQLPTLETSAFPPDLAARVLAHLRTPMRDIPIPVGEGLDQDVLIIVDPIKAGNYYGIAVNRIAGAVDGVRVDWSGVTDLPGLILVTE